MYDKEIKLKCICLYLFFKWMILWIWRIITLPKINGVWNQKTWNVSLNLPFMTMGLYADWLSYCTSSSSMVVPICWSDVVAHSSDCPFKTKAVVSPSVGSVTSSLPLRTSSKGPSSGALHKFDWCCLLEPHCNSVFPLFSPLRCWSLF